jgi:hypothetical protein
VVADLVRQHVGLREFAGRAELPLQLVIEAQIDVDLFVQRTVEGSGSGLRHAAGRGRRIAEQHELGSAVGDAGLLGEDFLPRFLRIVEHKRDELHEARLFRTLFNAA